MRIVTEFDTQEPQVDSESLSPRERQLLLLAIQGLTDQGIANELGISVATVSTYWGRVRIKYGPYPRAELVAKFVQSEMSRATAALKASEARLSTLIESSPLGVTLADPEGKILFANSAYAKLAGRPAQDLVGLMAVDLVHPDDRDNVAAKWAKAITDDQPYTAEYRLLRPDGSHILARSRGDVWHIDGKVGGRVGVIEDITASRAAEEARRVAEQRYRTLLALAPEAILTVDDTLRIVEFNPGAERTFGYTAEEIIGEPLTKLLPESFRGTHDELVRGFGAGASSAARPMAARSTVQGLTKDGEPFPCEVSILRETVEGKPLYTAILRSTAGRV